MKDKYVGVYKFVMEMGIRNEVCVLCEPCRMLCSYLYSRLE